MLDTLDLCQHVQGATHEKGHTLDLLITRKADDIVIPRSVCVSDLISDHCAISCHLRFPVPEPISKTTRYRKLKNIDCEAFRDELQQIAVSTTNQDCLTSVADYYCSSLASLLDRHAPLQTRMLRVRPYSPWYSPEIIDAKKLRRRYEDLWRSTGLHVHLEMYKAQRQIVLNLIRQAKRHHFAAMIDEHSAKPRQLFAVIDHLLHRKKEMPLPRHNTPKELAESFSSYFISKVAKIRTELDTHSAEISDRQSPVEPRQVVTPLESFDPVSMSDVLRLINMSAPKSCGLDPIPTSVVKDHAVTLAPLITNIVNLSLKSGEVPKELKRALVTPLLKKPSLDPNILKHYRPVSNLHYLSKILERVVTAQLSDHLHKNNLCEPHQSAYRTAHSTETALVRVCNDILQAIDNRQSVFLVLLDMSAAFDTIDHSILSTVLQQRYRIVGTALKWFKSYLSDRTQEVRILGESSRPQPVVLGVPQGSVLGPVLFTLYSAPLAEISRRHGLRVELYADDSQLYVAFHSAQLMETVSRIQDCVAEIRSWLAGHKLKMNDEKTIILQVLPPRNTVEPYKGHVMIGGEAIEISDMVKDLGVILDRHLNMEAHIKAACKASYAQLANISRIRGMLSRRTCETLVHAFVTNKIDYANSLLYGLPARTLSHLQRVQNMAARVIAKSRKYDHITPILSDLHWLPVKQRIDFKILTLAFRAIRGQAPEYINDLVVPYVPSRALQMRCSSGHQQEDGKIVAKGALPLLRPLFGTTCRLTSALPTHSFIL